MKIHRLLLAQLSNAIQPGKVLIVYGPRQVGKTTLVQDLLAGSDMPADRCSYINADELLYREALASQNRRTLGELLGNNQLLVIDEAQRVPDIGLNLKILVDNYPQAAIIATGSASFDLANKVSEPLTGRKLTFSLFPASYAELAATLGPFEARADLERWLIDRVGIRASKVTRICNGVDLERFAAVLGELPLRDTVRPDTPRCLRVGRDRLAPDLRPRALAALEPLLADHLRDVPVLDARQAVDTRGRHEEPEDGDEDERDGEQRRAPLERADD